VTTKTKRTYNLSPGTVDRVRALAGRPGLSGSQDGIVEEAIERMYRDVRDREEAAIWERAASDPEFQNEAHSIDAAFAELETWPE
jgi:hypothetical protein